MEICIPDLPHSNGAAIQYRRWIDFVGVICVLQGHSVFVDNFSAASHVYVGNFYTIDGYPAEQQLLFKLNPVYNLISYFRSIVLHAQIPSLADHLIILGYSFVSVLIGCAIYKKYNTRFLYYI